MSQWFDTKKEDIFFSDEKDEVYIWVDRDEFGSRYVSIKTKDLLEVLKQNNITK